MRFLLVLVSLALALSLAERLAGEVLEEASIAGLEGREVGGGELRTGLPGYGGWRRLQAGLRVGEAPRALARSARGGVAEGDEAGVSWLPPPASAGADPRPGGPGGSATGMRAVLPPVRDLTFDRSGALWIATQAGLYRWQRSGRPVRRRLSGEAGDSAVLDLASSGDVLLVATSEGAYWSSRGEIFQPLDVQAVGTTVRRVALRAAGDPSPSRSRPVVPGIEAEAWLLGTNQLLRIGGRVTTVGLRVVEREPLALPRPASELEIVDLAFDPAGRRLAIAYPDMLAIRSVDDPPASAHVGAGWRISRPTLAPGARIRSLAWTGDGLVLSTDHGVFLGARFEGPFLRSADPVGTADCVEVEERVELDPSRPSLLALCRSGLFAFESASEVDPGGVQRTAARDAARDVSPPRRAQPGPTLRVVAPASEYRLPPDPPVEEIRRHAFERSGLDPKRSADLWSGLRRRALWPELALRFGVEFDEDEARDRDQSFLSGETRRLFDHSRDRGQRFDAAVALDWDLGGVAYPLESVDLSRELRQVVSLRDDVADEINQLYFERQRLRASLATGGPFAPGEAERMRWRAREIEAGLDAWTGGFIARWRHHQRRRESLAPADPP